MAQRTLRAFSVLLLGLLVTACSVPPKQSTAVRDFESSKDFVAEGKLGIRSNTVAESARFVWRQSSDVFAIKLLDPFGRSALQLEGDTEQVNLMITGEDEIYSAETPEELMQAFLGWQVPVIPAKFWIQGEPDPSLSFASIDEKSFSQAGWEIQILETQDTATLRAAPRRIKLLRDDLQLTLIFSQWNLPN